MYQYQHYSAVPFVSDIIIDSYILIQVILRHYNKVGCETVETPYKIWEVYRNIAISDYTAPNWTKCFKGGYMLLAIKPRNG